MAWNDINDVMLFVTLRIKIMLMKINSSDENKKSKDNQSLLNQKMLSRFVWVRKKPAFC